MEHVASTSRLSAHNNIVGVSQEDDDGGSIGNAHDVCIEIDADEPSGQPVKLVRCRGREEVPVVKEQQPLSDSFRVNAKDHLKRNDVSYGFLFTAMMCTILVVGVMYLAGIFNPKERCKRCLPCDCTVNNGSLAKANYSYLDYGENSSYYM